MPVPKGELLIVDAHEDIASHCLERERSYFRRGDWMVSFEDHLDAPVSLVFATLFVPRHYKPYRTQEIAKLELSFYHELEEESGGRVVVIRNLPELEALLSHNKKHPSRDERKVGLVILMEGADPIGHPGLADYWRGQGVSIVGLTWANPNAYAVGNDYPDGPGLTPAGRQLLILMKRAGLILDTSHLNQRSFFEALQVWDQTEGELPVIASHSNAAAVYEHPRNLSDDQLRMIAERGGVVGLVLYDAFIADNRHTNLDDVYAHLEHMVEVMGVDHVGIGSDFDGGITAENSPDPFRTVADLPKLADYLADKRGWKQADIKKLMGENWLRVLREAWGNS